MTPYFGDFAEDAKVYIPFNTFDSNDPSASVTVTTLIASDIYVHKDGSTTDIVTDGATIAVDFDTITGNHLITIDTGAHADYTSGSEYAVRIEGATVDAGNINAFVGSFSIERSGGALALAKQVRNTQVVLEGGVVDSGSTTTIVDAALLTQATDNHWIGAQVQMTGGTAGNIGAVRTITDFVASTDTITFTPALVTAVQVGDTFVVLSGNYGVIEVDANNRVDIGAVAGTSQTAGDLAALITTLDTVCDAIKAKTDSLTFTVAGDVDANIQSVAGAAISEGGSDPASPIGQT